MFIDWLRENDNENGLQWIGDTENMKEMIG